MGTQSTQSQTSTHLKIQKMRIKFLILLLIVQAFARPNRSFKPWTTYLGVKCRDKCKAEKFSPVACAVRGKMKVVPTHCEAKCMGMKYGMEDCVPAREIFSVLDQDGNERITATELVEFSTKQSLNLTEEEIKKAIRKADTNNDGGVDFDEFVVVLIDELN